MSAEVNAAREIRRSRPVPRCPLQPDVACTLCKPGVSGPEDCPAVYLVMTDPELREELVRIRRELQLRS